MSVPFLYISFFFVFILFVSKRLAVLDGRLKLGAGKFPAFMYDLSKYKDGMKDSLLRGYLLIHVSDFKQFSQC